MRTGRSPFTRRTARQARRPHRRSGLHQPPCPVIRCHKDFSLELSDRRSCSANGAQQRPQRRPRTHARQPQVLDAEEHGVGILVARVVAAHVRPPPPADVAVAPAVEKDPRPGRSHDGVCHYATPPSTPRCPRPGSRRGGRLVAALELASTMSRRGEADAARCTRCRSGAIARNGRATRSGERSHRSPVR